MSKLVDAPVRYAREKCKPNTKACTELFLVQLSCNRSPLSGLPHRTGCWARSAEGCGSSKRRMRHDTSYTSRRNWTRLSAASLHVCLGHRKSAQQLASLCSNENTGLSLSSPMSVSELTLRGVDVVYVHGRLGTPCRAIEPALPFQIPRLGTCASAGKPPGLRYLTNHGHQAEVLVPIVEDAVLRGHAPSVLHWGWRRTHWVTELIRVLLPFTRLLTSIEKPSHVCHVTRPIGSGGGGRQWVRTTLAPELMRRALWRHCGLRMRAPSFTIDDAPRRERIVVLLRGDTQQQAHSPPPPLQIPNASAWAAHAWSLDRTARLGSLHTTAASARAAVPFELRSFANLSRLVESLRLAVPRASVRVAVTSASAPICIQARWVHDATIVISPHGAHLTNALWMARGAVLVEVMPWGMWSYEGYEALLKKAGILQSRILASRPPATQPHWRKTGHAHGEKEVFDQLRCEAHEECRRFYRAHSALYFERDALCKALMLHVHAARSRESICYHYQERA